MTTLNGWLHASLHPTDDRHRVTSLELFFDLVFVYALTNVTNLMEGHLAPRGIVEGVVVLLIVWFGWCAYAWLGNQARADEGLLRVAMVVAMAGMLFVAVSIPRAFSERGHAAMVLVVGYAIVRLVHIVVYLIAATGDDRLTSVIRAMGAVVLVVLALLLVGALVPPHARLVWWLAAVAFDQAGVYFVRSDRWRLTSASHFSERFGLIVLIAIGEAIISVGLSLEDADLTARGVAVLAAGLAITVCLWWLYFDVVALVAERTLLRAEGLRRAKLARDSYTYLHLPMVAGIVFVALGLLILSAGHEHVDGGRYALYGGLILYFAGHFGFRLRNVGSVNWARLVVATLLLVLMILFAAGHASALVQLVVPAVVLVALVGYEVRAHRSARAEVRRAE